MCRPRDAIRRRGAAGLSGLPPIAILATAIAATVIANGNALDLSIEEFVALAVEKNVAIADATNALEAAAEALSPGFDFDGVKLSISGNGRYSIDPPPSQDPFSPTASANLSVPLIPQISLSAQVSTDFETISSNYSLSVSPFANRLVSFREHKTYEQAALQLASLTASLPYQFESAAYDLLLAELGTKIASEKLDLEKKQFEVAKAQYEIGDLGWSQYNAAVESYSSAQRSLFDAERSELSARRQLVNLVGAEIADVTLTMPHIDEIVTVLEARRGEILAGIDDIATSSLISAQIELSALENQLRETPIFEPTISISANADLPFSSVSGGVSISLSSAQYSGDERSDLKADINDQREAIEVEKLSVTFEVDMLRRQMASAEELYESSVSSVENAEMSFEETKYYHEIGERTDVDLEEARINLIVSEQNRLKNAANLLGIYAEVLELIDLGRFATARDP